MLAAQIVMLSPEGGYFIKFSVAGFSTRKKIDPIGSQVL